MTTPRNGRNRIVQNVLHSMLSIAMWGVFGFYCDVVLGREIGPGTIRALLLLTGAVLGGLVVTVLWIGHNLRLARKFAGRRRGTPAAAPITLTGDTIGRPVSHPGLDVLREATIIDIEADDAGKRYRIAGVKEAS